MNKSIELIPKEASVNFCKHVWKLVKNDLILDTTLSRLSCTELAVVSEVIVVCFTETRASIHEDVSKPDDSPLNVIVFAIL